MTDCWHLPPKTPDCPGVYAVLVGKVTRWAKWTGEYWCNWGVDARRAAMCQWRGAAGGYPWRVQA